MTHHGQSAPLHSKDAALIFCLLLADLRHVLTSGAYFHFVAEPNNSLLVHVKVGGKQRHGAPQGPQQGQQNLTAPSLGAQRGSHHPSPTYTGDIAPGLIYGCFSRSSTKALLVVRRSCAAAGGGSSESDCLAIPKVPPPPPPPPGVPIQVYHSREVSQTPRKSFYREK